MSVADDVALFWLPMAAVIGLLAVFWLLARRSSLPAPALLVMGATVLLCGGASAYALAQARWWQPPPGSAARGSIMMVKGEPTPPPKIRPNLRCPNQGRPAIPRIPTEPGIPTDPLWREYGRFEVPTRGVVVLERTAATFSPKGWKACVSGAVVAEILIDADGKVVDGRTLRGLPFDLDKQASDAVREWRFAAAVVGDRRIPAIFFAVVPFDPNDERQRPRSD